MPIDAPTSAEYDVFANSGAIGPKQLVAPVRNGVDSRSGMMLTGWPHVLQSLYMMFETRYHERILREYVGTFVPHLLGKNIVETTLSRYFWAIATGCALWEPCYSITRILVTDANMDTTQMDTQTTVEGIRSGAVAMLTEGIYYPRGHLGDFTPEATRTATIVKRGGGRWDVS